MPLFNNTSLTNNTKTHPLPDSLINSHNITSFKSYEDAENHLMNKTLHPAEIAFAYYEDASAEYGHSAIFAVGPLIRGRGNIIFKNSERIDKIADNIINELTNLNNNIETFKKDFREEVNSNIDSFKVEIREETDKKINQVKEELTDIIDNKIQKSIDEIKQELVGILLQVKENTENINKNKGIIDLHTTLLEEQLNMINKTNEDMQSCVSQLITAINNNTTLINNNTEVINNTINKLQWKEL